MKVKSVAGIENDKQDAYIHFGCTSAEKKLWASLWGKKYRGFSIKLREILNNEAERELAR